MSFKQRIKQLKEKPKEKAMVKKIWAKIKAIWKIDKKFFDFILISS